MGGAAAARRTEAADINLRLQRKQGQAFQSASTELLYGGAAFGGKSHLMRVAAISWCVAIPGLQVYLFRRGYNDLYKNHMTGPTSFPALLAPWTRTGYARINYSSNQIHIGSSTIFLCHLQYEKDVDGYQGAEIHVLLMDELTQFTASMYSFLRGRVRMVGMQVPEQLRGVFPRVLASSNPGGIGHNWVKAAFIDPKPEGEIWRTEPKDGGMRRQFIRALMEDNPIGMAADPGYADRLEGLSTPELVRAMKSGDWNIVAGGAIDDLWKPERHVMQAFPIPSDWTINRAFDWGSSKPYSVGWFAESNGETVEIGGVKRKWPAGTVFQIAEIYGWNGRPNEGCRELAVDLARQILEREKEMALDGRVSTGPADPAIFAVVNGNAIADDMARAGVSWIDADAGPGSRKTGLERLRKMLKAAMQTPMEEPGLIFFDTCRHSLRTLPTLPRDTKKPDDVDTESEDHPYDMVRYRIMTESGDVSSVKRPW